MVPLFCLVLDRDQHQHDAEDEAPDDHAGDDDCFVHRRNSRASSHISLWYASMIL